MIFLICPIAGIKRKTIFAKPFQKLILGGSFKKKSFKTQKKY